MTNAEARFNKSLRPRKPEGSLGRTAQDAATSTLTQLLNYDMEVGEREIIYLSIHCHHQNDSCIKMGSDESHFNVSVGSDVTGRCPQTTTFLKRKESRSGIEPRSFRLPA